MTGREAYNRIKQQLTKAGIEDAGFEADILLRHVTGKGRLELETVSARAWQQLEGLAQKRVTRCPLQYLLGSWPFLGLEVLVGPGVLIPRPETEEVCLAALETLKGKDDPTVLDLCSGTGALALGIQSGVPTADVKAVEWDDSAFRWLKKNIEACAVDNARRPLGIQADALVYHEKCAAESLDLVISNPPYVTAAEYGTLGPELAFEPRQALVAEENGLLFYRVIAEKYRRALKPGGWLVFEIGAEQGAAVGDILERNDYRNVAVRLDMAGHNRIAMGQK